MQFGVLRGPDADHGGLISPSFDPPVALGRSSGAEVRGSLCGLGGFKFKHAQIWSVRSLPSIQNIPSRVIVRLWSPSECP